MLERLHPPGAPAEALDLLAAERPWEHAPAGRPRVLVNMVETLDGRIALDGGSTGLGGAGDRAMFQALRSVVDAVMAGTGTLRAEHYGRLAPTPERRAARRALGLAEDPLAIVITRSGDVPWEAPLFDLPEQHVAVVTRRGAAAVPARVRAPVDLIELDDPTPAAALRALQNSHGVRAVLCEGGPTLNRALLAEGVLDELFLTVSPLLAGGDGDVLRVLAGPELPEPAPLALRWVLRHRDELLLRYTA